MSEAAPVAALPGVAPSQLGESPFWHPAEQALYWCDIAGRALNRFHPASARHTRWPLPGEPGCCAPLAEGGLLLALRQGLVRFEPDSGVLTPLLPAPYDTAVERFNDGKADARGRLWLGTVYEPRDCASASLYCHEHGRLERRAGEVTVSNGLAWSPDGRTLYWADTTTHRIDAADFDIESGRLSRRREFARFDRRRPDQPLADYGGRPDGAAVDAQGGYWVAMYEGARVLRLSPEGRVLGAIALPVRCPTMPCFGGPDLKTLYVTSARHQRPADELEREPLAGCVLQLRVDVPGLPVDFARL